MSAQSNSNAFKVKLSPKFRRDQFERPVIFEATPDLTENRNVNYKTLDPVHMPGAIHVYTNTSSRTYSLSNIKLFSRTTEEATMNLARINQLRAWTMPRFGKGSSSQVSAEYGTDMMDTYKKNMDREYPYDGQGDGTGNSTGRGGRVLQTVSEDISQGGFEFMGAPPNIVYLSAYATAQRRGNVYKIPTVITNMSIPYPSDVDYINTSTGVPFPTMMQIDLQLSEVHAPDEYNAFNLEHFRNGELTGF
jgi:hypothetical protein